MNRVLTSALILKSKLSNGRSALWPGTLVRRYLRPQRVYLAITLVSSLLVIGCGFEPLLARNAGGPASDELTRIRIHAIADRSGQILRNHLIDDLASGRPAASPLYALEVTLTEPRQEIAVRRDESASRVAYAANAIFVLRDNEGRILLGGASSSSSTYEATTSEFASIAGQRSARERAMQEISADIRLQLAAYFSRARAAGTATTPRPTP